MSTPVNTLDALRPYEERIIGVVLDWAGDGPVEWEEMLNRIEEYLDVDLPRDMNAQVIRRIQRIGRDALREARL